MVHYIAHLNAGLDAAGLATQRFLMQSNGGGGFSAAGGHPCTRCSPARPRVQASAYLARGRAARPRTLDMGGTSADIAFIEAAHRSRCGSSRDGNRRARARHD
jgi:N-methylhydantoinase A/oxoprolinase/acetone carboxylase beta subunit